MKKYCAIVLLICVLLSSCRTQPIPPASPSPISEAPSPSVPPEETSSATPTGEVYAPDLLIEEGFWQQEYRADDGVLLLNVSYSWPQLSGDFPESMRMHFDDRRNEAGREAERLLSQAAEQREWYVSEGRDFVSYYWEENCGIEYNDGVYLSVFFEGSCFTGGAHDDETAKTDTFRLSDAQRITLDDLFAVDREVYVERLSALICEEIITDGEDLYYPEYQRLVRELFPVDCFCLTDDGIALFYNTCQIAPSIMRVSRFDLPRTEYEDIWKN